MTDLLTAARMRAIEEEAISSGRVTGLELMERAGRGAVEAILGEWPELKAAPHRAVVLCGPGNNGGDGFVVARLLKERGWEVATFFYGDPDKLPPDAKTNFAKWADIGEVNMLDLPSPTAAQAGDFIEAASHVPELRSDPEKTELSPFLVIDALFGIGLSRPLQGIEDIVWHWDYLTNFRDLNDARVVAIDVPSGLDADTGEIVSGDGMAGIGVLPADLTVTFHKMKRGLVDSPHAGKVAVADIGLSDQRRPEVGSGSQNVQ